MFDNLRQHLCTSPCCHTFYTSCNCVLSAFTGTSSHPANCFAAQFLGHLLFFPPSYSPWFVISARIPRNYVLWSAIISALRHFLFVRPLVFEDIRPLLLRPSKVCFFTICFIVLKAVLRRRRRGHACLTHKTGASPSLKGNIRHANVQRAICSHRQAVDTAQHT